MLCKYDMPWVGACGKEALPESGSCEDHSIACVVCKSRLATHGCTHASSLSCGAPLCDEESCKVKHFNIHYKETKMSEKQFVLIDLERTIKSGITHYWKDGGRGYTQDVNEVGRYPESVASSFVRNDFDRHTVGISERRFKELAGVGND